MFCPCTVITVVVSDELLWCGSSPSLKQDFSLVSYMPHITTNPNHLFRV